MAITGHRGFVSNNLDGYLFSLQCFIWMSAKLHESPSKTQKEIAKEMQDYFSCGEDEMPIRTIKKNYDRLQIKFKEHQKQKANGKI